MDTSTLSPPLQVFVVEDSPAVSERLQELVNAIPGAVCAGAAQTAPAAIEGIRRTRPDAVILDLRLADDSSGFDVMRALQNERVVPDFYVISSFALEPYRRLASKLGATAFLDKTADIPAMRGMLEQRAAARAARPGP